MTLPAFAAERRYISLIAINSQRPRSAANQPHAAATVDRMDRQTDGRTDTRPLRRPCCAAEFHIFQILFVQNVLLFIQTFRQI